jgi:hypothetical protein
MLDRASRYRKSGTRQTGVKSKVDPFVRFVFMPRHISGMLNTSTPKRPTMTTKKSTQKSKKSVPNAPSDSLKGKVVAGITGAIAGGIGKDVYNVLLHPLTVYLLDQAHTVLQHMRLMTLQSTLHTDPLEVQRSVTASDYFLRTAAAINAPGDWPDISMLTDSDLETVREAWKGTLESNFDKSPTPDDTERAQLLNLLQRAILMRTLEGKLSRESGPRSRKRL